MFNDMQYTETGHAKNVANFEKETDFCIGYGTTYNPSKNSIKVTALQTLLTTAKGAIAAVNSNMPAYSNAVAAREAAFEPLSKLTTRIINALKATDTTEQVIDSAKTITRKLQGRRETPKSKKALDAFIESTHEAKTVTPEEPKEISASQMSYDNRIDNLDRLIKLLGSVTQYAPNEADLKVTALTTLYNDLKAKNTAVMTALVPISNARIARNDILYKEKTGLVAIANDVKAYIKSLYGGTSPQYKQISKLTFTHAK